MLTLGLRRGEVIGLPWVNINLDINELDVNWQLQRTGRQLPIVKPAVADDALRPGMDLSGSTGMSKRCWSQRGVECVDEA